MTKRLPRVTAKQMIKVLNGLGYHLCRQSGSHKIFKNVEGIRVVVPYHASRILHPKLVTSIIKVVGLSIKEFGEFL